MPKDVPAAVRWHTMAAEQGHTEAMYRLGRLYQAAFSTLFSDCQAAEWFTRAAEAGHPHAGRALQRIGEDIGRG